MKRRDLFTAVIAALGLAALPKTTKAAIKASPSPAYDIPPKPGEWIVYVVGGGGGYGGCCCSDGSCGLCGGGGAGGGYGTINFTAPGGGGGYVR